VVVIQGRDPALRIPDMSEVEKTTMDANTRNRLQMVAWKKLFRVNVIGWHPMKHGLCGKRWEFDVDIQQEITKILKE
jgi:hypothetical protein